MKQMQNAHNILLLETCIINEQVTLILQSLMLNIMMDFSYSSMYSQTFVFVDEYISCQFLVF